MSAVAAVLFLTACAYLGAALFAPAAPETPAETAVPAAAVRPFSLRGIAVREEAVTDKVFESGKRVPAADTGGFSAVYFDSCDGYEYLSADMLGEFTPGRLGEILSATPKTPGKGRLVTGRDWYIAAFTDGTLPSDRRVRLVIDGMEGYLAADIAEVAEEKGRVAVLLRLTDGSPEALSLRKVTGKIILE